MKLGNEIKNKNNNNKKDAPLNSTCPCFPQWARNNTVHRKFMCVLSLLNLSDMPRNPSQWLGAKEEEWAYQTYPNNHCWYDTRRVLQFWPWYAGSLFGQTAAAGLCICVCVMSGQGWSGEGLGDQFTKLRKKKKYIYIYIPAGLVS